MKQTVLKFFKIDFDDFEIKSILMYYSTNILILIGKSMKNKIPKFIIYDEMEKKIKNEEEIDQGERPRNILNININRTQ